MYSIVPLLLFSFMLRKFISDCLTTHTRTQSIDWNCVSSFSIFNKRQILQRDFNHILLFVIFTLLANHFPADWHKNSSAHPHELLRKRTRLSFDDHVSLHGYRDIYVLRNEYNKRCLRLCKFSRDCTFYKMCMKTERNIIWC